MIKKLCYELYKVDWKYDMISKEREMDSLKSYYEYMEDMAFEEYTYNDYLEEFGYNEQLYVCYEEFLENEYLETNYIKHLLKNDKLFKLYLEDLWIVSSYNEDTEEQLDYYINENDCNVGDKAYLYNHEDGKLTEIEIVHIIYKMHNPELYNELLKNEDVLVDGEYLHKADTSAEFITDSDCYLVWFKYC